MRFANVCKFAFFVLILVGLGLAGARGQSVTISTPLHTVPFDRSLPLQTWQCSDKMATAGTHMLDFLDTNGAANGFVDCHGVVHPAAAGNACGSAGQICYNNNGVLDGVAGSSWNGSILTLPRVSTSEIDAGNGVFSNVYWPGPNNIINGTPNHIEWNVNPGTSQGIAWTPNFHLNTLGGTQIDGPIELGSNFGSPTIAVCTGVGTGNCDLATFSSDTDWIGWLVGSGTAGTSGDYQLDLGGSYPAALVCNASLLDLGSAWNAGATIKFIQPTGGGKTQANSIAVHWDNNGVALPSTGAPSVGFNVICFTHGG